MIMLKAIPNIGEIKNSQIIGSNHISVRHKKSANPVSAYCIENKNLLLFNEFLSIGF